MGYGISAGSNGECPRCLALSCVVLEESIYMHKMYMLFTLHHAMGSCIILMLLYTPEYHYDRW